MLAEGRIVKSGGKELALELEAEGLRGSASTTRGGGRQSMSAVAEQTGIWLDRFTSQPAAPQPWLQALRERGFARFAELGFPNTHNEEWRFTNVAPIARFDLRGRRRIDRLRRRQVTGVSSRNCSRPARCEGVRSGPRRTPADRDGDGTPSSP